MNCPTCGTSIPNQAKFCPFCGAASVRNHPAIKGTSNTLRTAFGVTFILCFVLSFLPALLSVYLRAESSKYGPDAYAAALLLSQPIEFFQSIFWAFPITVSLFAGISLLQKRKSSLQLLKLNAILHIVSVSFYALTLLMMFVCPSTLLSLTTDAPPETITYYVDFFQKNLSLLSPLFTPVLYRIIVSGIIISCSFVLRAAYRKEHGSIPKIKMDAGIKNLVVMQASLSLLNFIQPLLTIEFFYTFGQARLEGFSIANNLLSEINTYIYIPLLFTATIALALLGRKIKYHRIVWPTCAVLTVFNLALFLLAPILLRTHCPANSEAFYLAQQSFTPLLLSSFAMMIGTTFWYFSAARAAIPFAVQLTASIAIIPLTLIIDMLCFSLFHIPSISPIIIAVGLTVLSLVFAVRATKSCRR